MKYESTPKGAHESATTSLIVAAGTDFTAEDRLAAFVCGLETGLALRCDMDTAYADHEARHALVRPMLDALVADLNRRGVGDFAQLQERRRQHQLEAWQRHQANARPWPTETAPLHPHAIFGQPARQPVTTWR